MARFTTDFLTWLKGLFYTETEIDNLLENKLNTSEVQAHVTQFTNKDRINIDRLMRYMDNDGASDFYTLKLTGSSDTIDTINTTENTVEADGEKLPAETEQYINLYAQILKDDTIQTGRTDTVTFKLTDGTVLGTSKVNTGTTTGLVVPDSIYLSLGNTLESDIYYCYAEVTISGSVIKSNIFTLFVKDKNNIMSHTVWSGGDYATESFTTTNKWAINGENSIICTTKQAWQTLSLFDTTEFNNKTIILTANINTETNGALCIYYQINGNYQYVKSGYRRINGGIISVIAEIPSNCTRVWCRIDLGNMNLLTCVDNINLISV